MILPNGSYLLAVLPVLFTLLIFSIFLQQTDWRQAFLQACLAWGVTVTFITEGLSVFNQLTFNNLSIIWLAADILAGFFLYRNFKMERFKSIFKPSLNLKGFDYVLTAGILIYILITGLIAFAAPPNTTDSLTYHMSRVMHWIQNQSVGSYPTNISRQINIPPWSEYGVLQFQLLTGRDRLANSIQWFSFIGSIIGVSLIARELGAGRTGQLSSAAFCATIPIVVLEASSTQTDLTTAFWLTGFVYFTLHSFASKDNSDIFWIGCSLGLAILSKTSAYLFGLPFVIMILIRVIGSPARWEQLWRWAIAVVIILAINSGQYLRNYQLYKTPFGPTQVDGVKYTNEILTPASVTSNVVRNSAINFSTPFEGANHFMHEISDRVHQAIGIDENDPRTTSGLRFDVYSMSFYDATAGNLFHSILIAAMLAYCLIEFRKISKAVILYGIGLVFGFLIFCATLKWQIWDTRLEAPLFVMAAPVFGAVVSRINSQVPVKALGILLFVAGIPWLIWGQPRPLVGTTSVLLMDRNAQYFSHYPDVYKPYTQAAKHIEAMQASNVGLISGTSDPVYPLWVYLGHSIRTLRMEDVAVQNETRVIAEKDRSYQQFKPDVLAVTEASILNQNNYVLDGKTYQRVWQSQYISLFAPLNH